MADKLGISRLLVTKQIARLEDENIIRRVEVDKGGPWEVGLYENSNGAG